MKTIISIMAALTCSVSFAQEIVYKASDSMSQELKNIEKLTKCAYMDHKAVSIGYGTQRLENLKAVPLYVKGKPFCISEERALALFNRDIQYKTDLILALTIEEKLLMNQKMLDALVSFTYNIGFNGFYKSSVLKNIRLGYCKSAARAMTWYNKASGKVLKGLVDRRKSEAKLLLEGCLEAKREAKS